MPSPRLRLWQVLRDEYDLFHPGKYPAPEAELDVWLLEDSQLKHPQLALKVGRQHDAVSQRLFKELDAASQLELRDLDGSRPLSIKLRTDILTGLNKLLADKGFYKLYDKATVEDILSEAETGFKYEEIDEKLPSGKLGLVNRWLLEETFAEEIVSIDESLTTDYYRVILKKNHAALCLSGGGIRSATFNLGLLQGLARHGLLEKFEYLSTVSGGGFSGGWLSAWIKRHPEGLKGVVRELGKEDPDRLSVKKPLEPEPDALLWLRSYSNFLSPKLGLFSADTWTLVATILRNIFLNWLVFLPVLMAILMLPRLWVAFLARRTFEGAEDFSIGIGFIMGMIALLYIGLNLPSTRKQNRGQAAFLWLCLVPLIISAIALSTYVLRASEQHMRHDFNKFALYQIAIISVPWIVCAVYLFRVGRRTAKPSKLLLRYLYATVLIVIVQIIAARLMWEAATAWSNVTMTPQRVLLYACFAVPVTLAILVFTGLMLAGLTSNYTADETQEWLARACAWIFTVIIGWSAISVLVIYGPELLLQLPEQLSRRNFFSWQVLTTVVGLASGVISLYWGLGAKAPANQQEASRFKWSGILLKFLVNVAAIVFLVFLTIVLSFLLVYFFSGMAALSQWRPMGMFSSLFNWIPSLAGQLTPDVGGLSESSQHLATIYKSSISQLLLLTSMLLMLVVLFGRLINTNKFSRHYRWRNRIIRTYLGASNPNRRPTRFTGFDGDDNLRMHELKPTKDRKILHILNLALNLVGGEKLAGQERKTESFTVSPLHCGNYRLGYRRAESYGSRGKFGDSVENQGISLGTSIAISEAFVSPNMAYMESSPVIRFLMTLLNVRFGWWLGNSGRAGDGASELTRTYDLDSPRLSVKPVVKEALGMTNGLSDYIYLSDGGHFENFGLYEMVLRRCRLIVVGDATLDPEYSFESLGQALRKIRIDFGIPVEFKRFMITKPSRDEKGVYAAVGEIRYHNIDGGDPNETNGALILIKPTLIGNEARDILNYASQSGTFPQEFIGDHWFSESQFESYRALGSHIVDALCREPGGEINDRNTFADINDFRARVATNLGQPPVL